MSGHSGATNDLVYSPDGSTLASSSTDGTIKLWNLTTKQEVATLKSHDASVEELAFSPDGNILASASGDGTVRLWRAAAPAETNRPFVLPRRTTAPGTDRLSE
jgi:WD40 repeat protein